MQICRSEKYGWHVNRIFQYSYRSAAFNSLHQPKIKCMVTTCKDDSNGPWVKGSGVRVWFKGSHSENELILTTLFHQYTGHLAGELGAWLGWAKMPLPKLWRVRCSAFRAKLNLIAYYRTSNGQIGCIVRMSSRSTTKIGKYVQRSIWWQWFWC